jgi:hypothetical protein
MGAIYIAHPAGAEAREDLGGAQSVAGYQRQRIAKL